MIMTTRYWMLLMSCLLIIGCIPESQQLVIKSVQVPAMVKVGEVDYVILDCDYELQNTSAHGLVVKWFFESDKASDDPYTEYRAMKLNKPGIDLTGEYTCVISTFEDEKTENATMVIYATGEIFNFNYTRKTIKDDKDGLEATCMAKGLYPLPTLDISVVDVPDKQATKPIVTQREDGLYDILSRIELLDEELPEATATLECILGIPRANYRVSRMTDYNSGTATTTSATAISQHEMDVQALDNSNHGGGNFIDHTSVDFLLLLIHLFLFILSH
ncbi:PREDICTED: uncharacterized protein LOC106747748 isoform X2 [Dinoponera quadriceps]|uniref:Uncharacterized protein LOC106747748 isoform X2 n=1 Tax=Dinoponera quadriceps TaxID=609295 RepID=A0A6P3XRU4_DINQU|nr:PREDICTED: uncharacterized protein LOC106747748 isoform X2 [Dinoponera quadriceps]